MSQGSPPRRHPRVVNLDEIAPWSRTVGTKFGGVAKRLTVHTGGQGIGCTYFEVEPGRSAMPAHYHCANEEAIFVLEGEGTLRIGDDRVPVRPGDWITFPIGPEWPHRLENTGTTTLRYLCMSTRSTAEVVGYPDSNKVAALAGKEMGPGADPWVAIWVRKDAGVGYFDGEDVG